MSQTVDTSGTSHRNRWASEIVRSLGVARVIEFGFGRGSAIASLTSDGSHQIVDGIDRSTVAVERATHLNAQAISSVRVHLTLGDFTSRSPANGYDLAFAVNVNEFWRRPMDAFSAAYRWVKVGGALLLVYEAPSRTKATQTLSRLDQLLTPGFSASWQRWNSDDDRLFAICFARGSMQSGSDQGL